MTDPRKAFIERLREITTEYVRADMGPTAAMAEVLAALRALDRRQQNSNHTASEG